MAEEASDFHIFDLNDDCLTNIVKYLDSESIFVLQEAHKRFHNAIGASLALHKHEIKLRNVNKSSLSETKKCLQLFGHLVTELTFDLGLSRVDVDIEHLIARHCNGGNVKKCTFSEYTINNELIENNEGFFRSLNNLSLDRVSIDSQVLYKLLSITNRLQFLNVRYFNWQKNYDAPHVLSLISLHPLKELHIGSSAFDASQIENIPRFETLEKLTIELKSADQLSVLKCFPSLEYLSMLFPKKTDYPPNRNPTRDFESVQLKELRLDIQAITRSAACLLLHHLANPNKLESCVLNIHQFKYIADLDDSDDDEDIDDEDHDDKEHNILEVLGGFSELKSLSLKIPCNAFDLVNMVSRLDELRVLRLDVTGDEDDIDVGALICEIVYAANKLKSCLLVFSDSRPHKEAFYPKLYKKLSAIRKHRCPEDILELEICVGDYKKNGILKSKEIRENNWLSLKLWIKDVSEMDFDNADESSDDDDYDYENADMMMQSIRLRIAKKKEKLFQRFQPLCRCCDRYRRRYRR